MSGFKFNNTKAEALGLCGLCGKPANENGACEYHIEIFTAVIEIAVELAGIAGLTEDEEVAFVSAHIARALKNEALKDAKLGEIFTPESFKVTHEKNPIN